MTKQLFTFMFLVVLAANVFAETYCVVNIKEDPLNIRESADKSSVVIKKAAKGFGLRVLKKSSWHKILLNNGDIGYAHSDYIKINN